MYIINQKKSKCWSNLKLRTQICLIQLIILLIATSLIITVIQVFGYYIVELLQDLSKKAEGLNFSNFTKTILFFNQREVKLTFQRSEQQVLKTNTIYQFIQQAQDIIVQQSTSCLNNESLVDNYSYSSSFCYEIYNYTGQNFTLNEQLKLNGFLTQIIPILDADFDIMLASSGNQHFFTVWPGSFLVSAYNPQERPWYTNHITNQQQYPNNITFISNPFIHYTWKILMVAQTTSLRLLNGNLDGVIATNVNLSLISQSKIQYNDSQNVIISYSGGVMLSEWNETENLYIFNTSITHFNYDDFQQIINYTINNKFINNCQNKEWEQFNLLCRKSDIGDDYIIQPTQCENQVILLILFNLKQYYIQLNSLLQFFANEIMADFGDFMMNLLISVFCCIIFSSIVVILIFNPVIEITKRTQNQIVQQEIKQKIIQKNQNKYHYCCFQSQIMNNLQKSYDKLIKQKLHKSNQCNEIENRNYPCKKYYRYNMKEFKILIFNIDEQNQPQEIEINSIIQKKRTSLFSDLVELNFT